MNNNKIIARIAGLGATAAVAWWLKESYTEHKPVWQNQFDAHEVNQQYKYMETGWAHYSGVSSKMDHLSHAIQNFGILGVLGSNSYWNVTEMYHLWKTRTEGMMNDVILPNLVPIAIGIGGLYVGLGKNVVNAPFRFIRDFFKKHHTVFHPIWKSLRKITLRDRSMKAMRWVLDKVVKGGPGTLLLGGIGAILGYQFWRVHTHVAQHQLFKDFTSVNNGHE